MYGTLIYDVGVSLIADGSRDIRVSGWKPEDRGGAVMGEKVDGGCDYMDLMNVPVPRFTDHDRATDVEIRRMKRELQERFEEECRIEDKFNEEPEQSC